MFCTALENNHGANRDPSIAKPFAQEIQLDNHQDSKLCEACELRRTDLLNQREIRHQIGLHQSLNSPSQDIVTHCGCILPYSVNIDSTRTPLDVMNSVCGFTIERKDSQISGGGTGVVVTRGTVPKGCVLAMYPGK